MRRWKPKRLIEHRTTCMMRGKKTQSLLTSSSIIRSGLQPSPQSPWSNQPFLGLRGTCILRITVNSHNSLQKSPSSTFHDLFKFGHTGEVITSKNISIYWVAHWQNNRRLEICIGAQNECARIPLVTVNSIQSIEFNDKSLLTRDVTCPMFIVKIKRQPKSFSKRQLSDWNITMPTV